MTVSCEENPGKLETDSQISKTQLQGVGARMWSGQRVIILTGTERFVLGLGVDRVVRFQEWYLGI